MSTATIIAAGASNDGQFALIRYLSGGSRDSSFGTGGLVTTRFGVSHTDEINGIAIQPDNKIIAVGLESDDLGIVSFGVARYLTDGTLDTSFGTGGLFATEFGNWAIAQAVVLQPDNKIVVVGEEVLVSGWGLIRLLADGTLDPDFGTGGKVTLETDGTGNTFANASAVAVQGDGKIVVGGNANDVVTGGSRFALARFNTDGSLDSASFGTGGIILTSFGGASEGSGILGVALQGDGKIVAAGTTDPDGASSHFAVARYNTDGTLDSAGFGTGGKVEISFSGISTGRSLVIQGDGKIVVSGSEANSLFALARLNTDGTLDSAGFGTGGKVTTDFGDGDDFCFASVLEDDGLIVLTGEANSATTGTFALARYNTDGSLDTSFDADGLLTDSGALSAATVALSAPLIAVTIPLLQPANFAGNFRPTGGYTNA